MATAAKGPVQAEGLLRGACLMLAAATALLMGLDAETKTVMLVQRKAVPKYVQALWVMEVVAGAAAGYQLLQLFKCFYLSHFAENQCRNSRAVAWTCLLLDKGCTYVTFATTVAAMQACVVALDGVPAVQWAKLCNVYTRFCDQVAGSLACSMLAVAGMAVLSGVSAHNLFRLYPSRPSPEL